VNGTSQVTDSSGRSGRDGRVVGKFSGSRFSFNDTHEAGTLTTDCSAELEGTLELHDVNSPRPSYPPGYPVNAPSPPPARTAMSGFVRGSACGSPFSGTITLWRN
jgi:hypothetical protein